jgi:hypothetical protein
MPRGSAGKNAEMDRAEFNALHMPALEQNEVRHNLLLGLMSHVSGFTRPGRRRNAPLDARGCRRLRTQGILTGPDDIGHRIAPWFERYRRKKVQPDRAAAIGALSDLLSEATALATAARRAGVIHARPPVAASRDRPG